MRSPQPFKSPPVVRQISSDLDTELIFRALAGMPGRVWFDSSNSQRLDSAQLDRTVDDEVRQLSRYSFLTADPIHQLTAYPGDPDPWPKLAALARSLPRSNRTDLPPFQGGIAGTIGYESARWLEPDELKDYDQDQINDLLVPAMSVGVYDWVIAIDHIARQGYLISQGFDAQDLDEQDLDEQDLDEQDLFDGDTTEEAKRVRAEKRADQIEQRLSLALEDASITGVDSEETEPDSADPTQVTSDFESEEFRDAVQEVVDQIRLGAAFQVNIAHRLLACQTADSDQIYQRLRTSNPAPFAGFYDGGDFQVLSSSPEGFLKVRGRQIETRPIKGTVPRTGKKAEDQRLVDQLLASEKDHAENVMIVDLMRNDLSRVCEDDSVLVTRLCQVERYQFVHHLVSVVEGRLSEDADVVDLLRVCFPGGSVTGAPKIEAMRMIARLERHPRGPYCGSMGYISCSGDADFNILIRTITASDGKLQFPVGGGITARSLPHAEEAETWAKAEGMLQAVGRPAQRISPVVAKG